MSTILPEGEALKRAVQWISDMKQDAPDKNIYELINEASAKFDLSPKDADFLINLYQKGQQEDQP
ncbi:MAG: hypothetical protein D6814_01270 [Calditrichaeota bacterium]|nr:MAG: hypothetical protein D6814_01270 [Calditrichota bacterium]